MFCHDTEILTRKGFMPISRIEKNEKILVKNPSTSQSRWANSKDIVQTPYSGEIHYFKTRYWESPRFTPNQFMWTTTIKQHMGGVDEMSKVCERIPYSHVWRKHIVLDHKVKLNQKNNSEDTTIGSYDYNQLTLYYWLGIVATDGHLTKKDAAIIITQCKDHNISEISRVMDILFPGRWKQYSYDRETNKIHYFTIYDSILYRWALNKINRIKKERRLINIFDDHPRLLNQFMMGALLGDGWENKETNSVGLFCGVSEDLAKDYQAIMSFLSRRTNLIIKDQRGKTTTIQTKKGVQTITSKNIMYKLSIHGEGASTAQRKHHIKEEYKGNVYSPVTKEGLVFVRRRGMAFWSGSIQEEEQW